MAKDEPRQLRALADLHETFARHGVRYWLFGGWAVDFHVGEITREHGDIDVAIWLADHGQVAALLADDGWRHAPESDEDGSTGYERDDVRLEVAFLARDADGQIYTPIRDGRAGWADGAFGDEVAQLCGVHAHVIGLNALRAEKADTRDDPVATAKDRADLTALSAL
jgi:hypothetical protein